jgi:rubrerythrin
MDERKKEMEKEVVDRLLSVFRDAMELERRGIAFYTKAAEITANPGGKRMFLTLAHDEEEHLKYLHEGLHSLVEDGTLPSLPPHKAAPTGEAPKRPDVFASPKEATEEVKATAGDLDALKRGIQAEKDSIALYRQGAAAAQAAEAEEVLEALATWEEGHLTILQGEYDYITGTGFWFDFQEFDLDSAT